MLLMALMDVDEEAEDISRRARRKVKARGGGGSLSISHFFLCEKRKERKLSLFRWERFHWFGDKKKLSRVMLLHNR